jgi:hypothetical protein
MESLFIYWPLNELYAKAKQKARVIQLSTAFCALFGDSYECCTISSTMSANLFFNGIRISVPVDELAEAMRQLASLPREVVQSPSATRSADGALDLFTENPKKLNDIELTLAFLKTISEHEISGGAPVHAIARALGASHVKGIGGKASIVNRVLDKAGFATPDVYSNSRDSLGDRYWKGGHLLSQAMRTLDGSIDPEADKEDREEEEDETP